jgi:hypothetical protein
MRNITRSERRWRGCLPLRSKYYSELQSYIVISGGILSFLPVMSSLKYMPAISTPDELVVCGSATAALALISPLLVDAAMDMATSVTSRIPIEVDDDIQLFYFLSPSEMLIALCGLAVAPCMDLGTIKEHNPTASACARTSRLVLVVGAIMKSLYRMNSKVWSGRVVKTLILSLLIFAVSSVYSDAYQLLGDPLAVPLTAVKAIFGLFFTVSFFTLVFIWTRKICSRSGHDICHCPTSAPDGVAAEELSPKQSISSGFWRRFSGHPARVNSDRSLPGVSGGSGGGGGGGERDNVNGSVSDNFRKLSDDKVTVSRVLNVEKEVYGYVYTIQ